MAKFTREEFSKKYIDKFDNEDSQLEFLEDVSDSFVDGDYIEKSKFDDIETKYNDLKEKYKTRFFEAEEKPKKEEPIEELKEKNYIDIKSLW